MSEYATRKSDGKFQGLDFPSESVYCSVSRERRLMEFLEKTDLEALHKQMIETKQYRQSHTDRDRPVVLYGIRKKHKCIKKEEIAVVIDLMPRQDKARMAETHWYGILYKRPATDLEWQEMKKKNPDKRYWTWPYFIGKGWTVDKIVSHIVQDDSEGYGLDTQPLILAFEGYLGRNIRQATIQTELFQ